MHTIKKAHEIHSGWFKYREEFAIAVTQLKELPVLISLHNWHKEVLTKEERWAALKSVVFVLWPVRMHIVPQKLTNRKKTFLFMEFHIQKYIILCILSAKRFICRRD